MKWKHSCLVAGLIAACSDSASPSTPDANVAPDAPGTGSITLHPGDNVQAALIAVHTGQTIFFTEGTYNFTDELSLSVAGVTLKGMGARDKIIFDFAGQVTGGNGLSVTAGDFILDGVTIRDTKGDAVRIQGVDADHKAKNITLRNVKVYWTAGSSSSNPGYALYPTTCENVLIENCEVHGASDAGLYVGQSANIMVRNNLVMENENGIEIENSTGAEVMGNMAMDNVGGILVFNLPNLPVKTGALTVVHDNMIMSNNHAKFPSNPTGTGAIPPPGSGMILLAADRTEIRNNMIVANQSTGILIASCPSLPAADLIDSTYCMDPGYDAWSEGVYIHDNTFSGNGTNPQEFYQAFWMPTTAPFQDMLYDGAVDTTKTDPNVDNKLCIKGNGSATFVDVNVLSGLSPRVTDLSGFDCTHSAVPGINVNWGVE